MRTRRSRQDDTAELAALADGSLAPERRAALEARVAASSELADRLAEQERAVSLAQERCGRGRGAGGPAGTHRGTATSGDARCGRGGPRPGRYGSRPLCWSSRSESPFSIRAAPASASTPPSARLTLAPGSERRGDDDRDVVGLADRAARDRTAAPRGPALLPGVAAQRCGCARAHRDVQRGPEGHAVGGRRRPQASRR